MEVLYKIKGIGVKYFNKFFTTGLYLRKEWVKNEKKDSQRFNSVSFCAAIYCRVWNEE